MGSRVLFISPHLTDATRLARMLDGAPLAIDHTGTLAGARALLRERPYRVVLTESTLPDGGWLQVLDAVRQIDPEIEVIVTRPGVDTRFWAEVLNRGGYDMLAQPFSEIEVRHVLGNACTRIHPVHAGAA